tara:strand:+ start:2255 stop:2440 length:186 start_codon:yes stop_codon:yes gene_type:complete
MAQNSNDLYSRMEKLFTDFQENHKLFVENGNKAAGTRARKTIGELKKMVTDYRKASVTESK